MAHRTRPASHRAPEILTVVSLLFGCSGAQLDELEVADEAKRIQSLMLAMNIGTDGAHWTTQSLGQEEQCRKPGPALQKCNKMGYTDPGGRDACASMLIADYDRGAFKSPDTGEFESPYTFCGTMIGWIDRESLYSTETERSDRRIGSAPPSEFSSQFGMKLEALWGKDGVLCIERPRWLALAGNDPVARVGSCLKDPGPMPEPCSPDDSPESQRECARSHARWLQWHNQVRVNEKDVLFASYVRPNESSLSIDFNETKSRHQPSGAIWPLPPAPEPWRPRRNCDPDYADCAPPAPPLPDSIRRLATAGFLLQRLPLRCTLDSRGLCKAGTIAEANDSQLKEVFVWEKRNNAVVTDYVISSATTPDDSFGNPGNSFPGSWARAASLGYIYDVDSKKLDEDAFLRQATVKLSGVVRKGSGKHFFAPSGAVPPAGFSLVRIEGSMLGYPHQASQPVFDDVLRQWADRSN